MNKVLAGKVAIITGANQGLGLEIAKKYASSGAHLMLCARNVNLLEAATHEVAKLAGSEQKIVCQVADVSNESDVNELVAATIAQLGGCHVLVNNAGVYGPKGEIESIEWVDWVRAIEINIFGSILMSRAVLPHFKMQHYGKIIQLSGGGATSPMPRLSAYAVSKVAIVRYAETLAEEVRGSGIDVNSIAPGALNTRMLEEILEAGPDKVGKDFYERSMRQKETGGAGLVKGADLALFLASPESDGITAKLISAVWDSWREWPNHLDQLSKSDAYTLRRISGRDRGMEWGDV
ncbi:SDR family oxidoreductase [Polynucleobacter sp. MWH-Creno-3A4]|uniref:SDR family NAD(P)-dependent oxidoreductase n=1 Tax=Polynucleobacter sp. MWH-Creno-3A4 TaxID=1855886 RepID=UPI001C0E0576|nr:SDR family oxidoreductase [Polynucleobacter sp. MWH-Creno-3A4]MBU3606149.1 SDR family oxidoreductase [Polynucleobacter sp. MWH-Creno-3A4]